MRDKITHRGESSLQGTIVEDWNGTERSSGSFLSRYSSPVYCACDTPCERSMCELCVV